MSAKARFRPGRLALLFLPLLLWAGVIGCDKKADTDSQRTILTVWFHTGRPAEQKVMQDQVRRFQELNPDIRIQLTMIPEGDYNTQVQAAAADGSLPDVLDLDGPYLSNYAWKGHLLPLDGLLPAETKQSLLPSLVEQGTYHGRLYGVGTFDSGLGLYASRKQLEAVKARIPKIPEQAWTAAEFDRILAALAKNDPDDMVLDLRLDYRGEWYTYAFSPVIQSGGGDLIDRAGFQTAQGFLNGPQAVAAAKRLGNWFRKGYVDPNTDTTSFTGGRVALSWCGHWEYPRYHAALGDDLVLLPLPDFGTGVKTGMGSWCWALTTACKAPEKGLRFLLFLLEPKEILAMCAANGAIPATRTTVEASPLYRQGGPLHLFIEQLRYAVPRPRTPAYPVITSAFQQAFQDIRHGVKVRQALDRAVAIIDEDILDNRGYPILPAKGQAF